VHVLWMPEVQVGACCFVEEQSRSSEIWQQCARPGSKEVPEGAW